jgi:hypothetical protein
VRYDPSTQVALLLTVAAAPGAPPKPFDCGSVYSRKVRVVSMAASFRTRDAFGYFRMGLVTGIVDKHALVQWADCEIARNPSPEHDVIELALTSGQPYSQTIRLLTSFEGKADYSLSLKLLFAHAGLLLERDPRRASEIVMGLRLLNEEEYFPRDIKVRIAQLRNQLDLQRQALLTVEDFTSQLSSFLDQYKDYRPLLCQTVSPLAADQG